MYHQRVPGLGQYFLNGCFVIITTITIITIVILFGNNAASHSCSTAYKES